MDQHLIEALELGYDVGCANERWLRRLLRGARRLDRGMGGIVHLHDVSRSGCTSMAASGAGRGWRELAFALAAALPVSQISRSCYFVASQLGEVRARRVLDTLAGFGAADLVGLALPDGGGGGVDLWFPSRRPIATDRSAEHWSRVAEHWTRGLQLRRRLASLPAATGSQSGEDLGELALRQAALAIDRARELAGYGGADEVARLRGALLDGSWSFRGSFAHEGRLFFIARRNDPARLPLSQREVEVAAATSLGNSNKLIAFQLGLGPSTVATHLAQATAKLGLASRRDLILFWRIFDPGGEARIARFDAGGGEHAVIVFCRRALPGHLTCSEREIVELALMGVGNAEIARRLRIAVRTVANELARSYKKLEVGSRAELAARWSI